MKKLLSLSVCIILLSNVSAQTWQEADSLRNVYFEKESFDTALVYAEKAVDLVKEEFGEMDTLYADMLNGLVSVYAYSGNYNSAVVYAEQEREIREKIQGVDHSEYGTCLACLGWLYKKMGQYDKTLPLYLEAIENCEKSLGKEHSYYGTYLNNLASLYKNMGQYDKALPLYLEALENTEKSLGKEHSDYWISLNNLALLYSEIGQYDKALPLYLEALENCEKSLGKEHSSYGAFLNNLAQLYRSIGQYDKALPLYLEALENCEKSLGKEHSSYGAFLNSLALLYESIGQYDKALPLFLEALENCEKSLGKEHSDYGISLNNLALLYSEMGQYDKALPLYLEALENLEKSLGKEHSYYGISLNSLAILYESMGQYDEALPFYLEALENLEKSLGKEHSEYGICLNNLALLYESMGQYDKALPLYRDAIQNNFYNINQAFSFLSESEKEKFIKTLSSKFNNYKSFFMDYAPENPEVAREAYNIELATKGMILQAGIQMREAIEQSSDSAALAKYDQWQALRLTIAKQHSQPVEKRLPNLPEMEAEAEALEGDLARVSSAFAESQKLGTIKWQDVQHVLNPNEACVEFSSFAYKKEGENTDSIMYVALVLLPGSAQPILVPLCEQKQLDSILVQSLSNKSSLNRMYRAAMLPDFNSVDYGKRLYELIWQPLEKYIPENSLVYFAPSGSLHKIAFAAIPVDDKTRLSDKYRLMQLSSTALLLQPSKFKTTKPESIALFGGINYDAGSEELLATAENIRNKQEYVSRSVSSEADRGSFNWGYLPGTLQEVTAIESIAKKKKVATAKFTGNAAIEEQFKSLKGNNSPRIVHISTHGFFFEDAEPGEQYNAAKNPLNRAGLLFAGANNSWQGKASNDGIDDGILTAYEATNVILGNTELVVLSACETGLGEIKGSEGVFGLQRAFKNAGAEYIIMSLWKVPDAETAEFMEYFYKKLFGGESIPDAFRNTQQYMNTKYPDEPYKWAAFVLVR
ncbi:MAG: CHAT domain-containing protein [Bacteroidales bacterium]|nr:CHAT domain-containing protein [Bacteroidales bacterium]